KSFCAWLKRCASDSTSAVRLGSGTLNWNRTGCAPHARPGRTRGSSHHARSAAATTPAPAIVRRSCRRERAQRSSIVCLLSTAGVGAFAAASTGALGLLALSIVTAIAIGDTVFFESTRALGLGRAMTISMTYPLGAAALAAAFLGEPVTLAVAAGALLTLGGI